MKQFIFRIMLFMMFLSVLVFSDAAADALSDGFVYEILPDGTASITDCYLEGDVVIPSQIDGYTVTNLAKQLFFGSYGITSVSIPATVTYFGDDPDDNMWDYVFSYSYNLEKITVDPNNTVFCSVDGVLFNKAKTILINYPTAKENTIYHVPESVRDLCCTSFARSSNRNLRELYLDGKDTWWYTYTFYSCGDLTVYYLPGGMAARKVKSEIENGLSHESDSSRPTFTAYTGEGGKLTLPDNLTEIGDAAFEGGNFVTVVIPEGCVSIGSRAFADCMNLRYVYISMNTDVADSAFEGCEGVTFIYTD